MIPAARAAWNRCCAKSAPDWDPARVVLVIDHYVPESDEESRRIVRIAREWAVRERLPNLYDSQGICHVVLPQGGHLRPGMFCVGGDSHHFTHRRRFGAYMFGIGSTEMLGVAVTGGIWVRVPRTLMMRWNGRLGAGVTAKDMMLRMIGRLGMNGGRYQAVEFCGEAVRALSMQERMTLSNMSAELGSQVGLVAPDATTEAWLREAGVRDRSISRTGRATPTPTPSGTISTPPRWRRRWPPRTAPPNAADVSVHAGVAVQAAISRLHRRQAGRPAPRPPCCARRRVAAGVKLMVAPASLRDQNDAEREGVLQTLLEAGAQLLPTSCGACAGYGGSIPDGATVISTTARNFKGRMGSGPLRSTWPRPTAWPPRRPRAASSIPGGAAMNQHGRVWRVGADIDTDALAPGAYMKFGIDEIARHCLQRVRPNFAAGVRPGDVLVAGPNRHRLLARTGRRRLVRLGVAAVVAPSYNGLYFRNAFNVGLLLLTCPHAARLVEGERVSLDPDAGRIHRRDGEALACEPLPDFLLDMVRAGGLLNQLKALQRSAATGRPGSGQCHRILTNRNCHHAGPRHPGRAQRPAGTDRR